MTVLPVRLALAAVLVGALAAPALAQRKIPPPSREAAQFSFAPVVKKAAPAVVNIYVRGQVQVQTSPFGDDPFFRRFFGTQERMQSSLGSGVIVSPDGVVVTNTHVVKLGSRAEIKVVLADKREFDARVLFADEKTDIAILKLEGADRLSFLDFEDSDGLEVGDMVLAIGNPFGVFGNTVTMGIVSALGRTQIADGNPFESFIQTDAAINQGNSGGALVNAQGELVGINSSIFTRTGDFSGIGFAIPTAIARPIMEQLIAHGEVKRGYIGANLGSVTPDIAKRLALKESKGAFVAAVIDGAPGSRAGLRVNDVIVEINGRATADRGDAVNTIAMSSPEQTLPLKVLRDGEIIDLKITLGRRPQTRR